MACITHIRIAHDDGGTLLLLGYCQYIIPYLAQLGKLGRYILIVLGVAVAAISVHVGDIDIHRHAFGHSNLIMTEAFLYASVGTAGKSSLFGIKLHHCFAGSRNAILFPEEVESVGISSFCQLCGSYSAAPRTGIIIRQSSHKLLIIFKVFTYGHKVPSKVVYRITNGRSTARARTIGIDRANNITDIRQSIHIQCRTSKRTSHHIRVLRIVRPILNQIARCVVHLDRCIIVERHGEVVYLLACKVRKACGCKGSFIVFRLYFDVEDVARMDVREKAGIAGVGLVERDVVGPFQGNTGFAGICLRPISVASIKGEVTGNGHFRFAAGHAYRNAFQLFAFQGCVFRIDGNARQRKEVGEHELMSCCGCSAFLGTTILIVAMQHAVVHVLYCGECSCEGGNILAVVSAAVRIIGIYRTVESFRRSGCREVGNGRMSGTHFDVLFLGSGRSVEHAQRITVGP